MNCQDVVAFVIEPGTPPRGVQEHLQECADCRARVAESRRVAALLADLSVSPGSGIVAEVMRRIGYGNGRPMRDKILEQLEKVREELDEAVVSADAELDERPSPDDVSVAEIRAHLSAVEATRALEAERSLVEGVRVGMPGGDDGLKRASIESSLPAAEGASHTHTINGGSVTAEELRRVRDRTLRLVSGLDPKRLDHSTAELLRSIYRHEAEHVAQVNDTLWRLRRKAELGKADLGDGH